MGKFSQVFPNDFTSELQLRETIFKLKNILLIFQNGLSAFVLYSAIVGLSAISFLGRPQNPKKKDIASIPQPISHSSLLSKCTIGK